MVSERKKIGRKISIQNRKASYNYFLSNKYIAGIVLKGSEIKSIRMGKISLTQAYCLFIGNELWIRKMHISKYEMSSFHNHEVEADRKLLLTKKELRRLSEKSKEKGSAIIPTHLFTNDKGLVKLEIALGKGKKLYDKRQVIKERESKRELRIKEKYPR